MSNNGSVPNASSLPVVTVNANTANANTANADPSSSASSQPSRTQEGTWTDADLERFTPYYTPPSVLIREPQFCELRALIDSMTSPAGHNQNAHQRPQKRTRKETNTHKREETVTEIVKPRIAHIVSLPGCGKTSLVHQFERALQDSHPDVQFLFVSCASKTWEMLYRDLALSMGTSPKVLTSLRGSSLVQHVLSHMEKRTRRTVFVLDEVDTLLGTTAQHGSTTGSGRRSGDHSVEGACGRLRRSGSRSTAQNSAGLAPLVNLLRLVSASHSPPPCAFLLLSNDFRLHQAPSMSPFLDRMITIHLRSYERQELRAILLQRCKNQKGEDISIFEESALSYIIGVASDVRRLLLLCVESMLKVRREVSGTGTNSCTIYRKVSIQDVLHVAPRLGGAESNAKDCLEGLLRSLSAVNQMVFFAVYIFLVHNHFSTTVHNPSCDQSATTPRCRPSTGSMSKSFVRKTELFSWIRECAAPHCRMVDVWNECLGNQAVSCLVDLHVITFSTVGSFISLTNMPSMYRCAMDSLLKGCSPDVAVYRHLSKCIMATTTTTKPDLLT